MSAMMRMRKTYRTELNRTVLVYKLKFMRNNAFLVITNDYK